MNNGLTDDSRFIPHHNNPGQRINHTETPVAGSAIAIGNRNTNFKGPVVEVAPQVVGKGKKDLA